MKHLSDKPGGSSWGETYLRRTARGEDHASAALAADHTERRLRAMAKPPPAPPPKRGDGTCVISVTTGSETRTISVSSVREAIAALEWLP